jgi:hypothetical protein
MKWAKFRLKIQNFSSFADIKSLKRINNSDTIYMKSLPLNVFIDFIPSENNVDIGVYFDCRRTKELFKERLVKFYVTASNN